MSEYGHLKTITEIDNATRALAKLERTLEDISTEGKSLKFDFVAIQMIDKVAKTIETVEGEGLQKQWFAISRNSIKGDPAIWEIQAELVMTAPPRMEIISGFDRRFDTYIFQRFGHKN